MSTTTLRTEQATPLTSVPVVDGNMLRGLGYGLLFSSVLWSALGLLVHAAL
jgi:hypothetical protein